MDKSELEASGREVVVREVSRLMCMGDAGPVKLRRGAEALCLGTAYSLFGGDRVREVVETIDLPEDAEPFRDEIGNALVMNLVAVGEQMGGTPSGLLEMLAQPGVALVREYAEKIRNEAGALPDLGMRIDASTPSCVAELNNWGNIVLLAEADPASAVAAVRFIFGRLARQTLPVAILVDGENAANMAALAEMHVLAELVHGNFSTISGVRKTLRARKRRGVVLAWSALRSFGAGLELLAKSDKRAELVELLAAEEASLLTAAYERSIPGISHQPESNLYVHRVQLREHLVDPTKPDSRPGERLYIDDVMMAER